MSLRELSKRTGLGHSSLSGYERDEREPGVFALGRIARVLEVSTDYLMGLTDSPNAPDPPEASDDDRATPPYRSGNPLALVYSAPRARVQLTLAHATRQSVNT